MIVTVDRRLFQQGLLALVRCLRFVFAASTREHVLLTDPVWDAEDDTHPVRVWLNALSSEVQEAVQNELERSLDKAATMTAHAARLRVEPIAESRWDAGVLTPEDALRAMYTPLWLALENGRNDLEFLRRILERHDRAELDKHIAEGLVEIPLGGGTGELAAFLARLKKPDGATSWIRRLRSWAMFDRDAHSSDPRQPSATSEKLRDHVVSMQKPWPFPGHQLGRRTIENYLPFEALDKWAEDGRESDRTRRRQQVEAFKSADFGSARRACFNMKEGFEKDVAQEVRDELSQRRKEQYKLKRQRRQLLPRNAPANHRAIARPAVRWLKETELPVVFQGMQNEAFRNRLNRGFGTAIAALYREDSEIDDVWFHRVFDGDPAAQAWRKQLVESLWSVL
ncbi:hypothetical protein WMF37_50425 [Sorangium sp. So ce291]|uniref:hypothetical protein n=1 Tax=Sorangium sp. So ce291 TaxID=3133294 RepID=UPI003F5DC2BD